jgi:hypothetical protein
MRSLRPARLAVAAPQRGDGAGAVQGGAGVGRRVAAGEGAGAGGLGRDDRAGAVRVAARVAARAMPGRSGGTVWEAHGGGVLGAA